MRTLTGALVGLLLILALAPATAGSAVAAEGGATSSCAAGPTRVGDEIVGTPCADTIVVPAGVAVVDGGPGDDTIRAAPVAAAAPCSGECRHLGVGSQTFNGGPGNDVIFGDRGNDILNGGEGADSLYGGIGDDELRGGPGDDLLSGGFGADSIDGEGGDDFVRGDATLDRIVDSGGDDGDTLSFATGVTPGFPNNPGQGYPSFSEYAGFPGVGGERGVFIELEGEEGSLADNGVAPDGGGVDGGLVKNDDLQGEDFETIIGTPFSDYIVGSTGAETIYGGGGADVLIGNGGADHLVGGADGDSCSGNGAVTSGCESSGKTVSPRDAGEVSVGVMAPETGSNPGLYLAGSSGADTVTATYAAGTPDTVTFTLGAGSFDPESAAGGSCELAEARKAVCELSEPPDSLVLAGLGGDDTLNTAGFPDTTSVVELGGAGDDTLTGADQSEDVLADGPGDDHLYGRGDDDALLNNEGEDALDGGTGSDLLLSNSICDGDTIFGGEGEYRDNASWTKLDEPVAARLDSGLVGEPVAGQPACPGGSLDHLQSIEDMEGSRFGDFLYGDGGDNQLLGHLGADTYYGLGGEDTILANSADSDLVIDCGGDPGDTAFIDLPTSGYQDPAPSGCEKVFERPPNDFRPPETPTGPPPPPVAPKPPPARTKKPTPTRDRTAPQTSLLRHPPKTVFSRSRLRSVAFAFRANEAGSSFRCKLDRGPFKPCRSPRRYRLLAGAHTMRVFAIDPAGNRDRTPATFSFRIRRR